jgi:hypothetical protein
MRPSRPLRGSSRLTVSQYDVVLLSKKKASSIEPLYPDLEVLDSSSPRKADSALLSLLPVVLEGVVEESRAGPKQAFMYVEISTWVGADDDLDWCRGDTKVGTSTTNRKVFNCDFTHSGPSSVE